MTPTVQSGQKKKTQSLVLTCGLQMSATRVPVTHTKAATRARNGQNRVSRQSRNLKTTTVTIMARTVQLISGPITDATTFSSVVW